MQSGLMDYVYRLPVKKEIIWFMEMPHTCIFIFIVLVTRDVFARTLHLSPEHAHVVENDSLRLNCSFNGSTSSLLQWKKHDVFVTSAFTLFNNSECLRTGFLASPSYAVRCRNDWALVEIKNVYRNQSGHSWQCSIPGSNIHNSNQVRLYVIVPVESVQMISNTEWVVENAVTEFACDTSASRPAPFVFRFLVSPDQKSRINISNASSQLPSADLTENLTEVRSVLAYSFNRTYGGWNIYCLAVNIPGKSVKSAQKELIIFFPPEGPPSIRGFINGSIFRIIETENVQLSCTVTGGNPTPNITWSCLNGNVSRETKNNETLISYITWEALRNQNNRACVCTATHNFGTASVFVVIEALYKATVMQFFVGEQIQQKATVNESDDVTFWCSFDSKPSPVANLSYKGNVFYVSHSHNLTYTKTNMQCNDFGTYMCSGMNDYNNGKPSVKTLKIYVNCSPRPSPDVSWIEKVASARDTEATLSFTALAYPVPGPSGFTWYFLNGSDMMLLENSSNLIISSSALLSKLTIRNVKESDYGEYLLRIANTITVFEQRYSLEPHASTPRPLETSDSSNTGAFVAVGFVSVVTTLIIVGFVYIIYRHNRDRQKHEHAGEYKQNADARRSSNNDESSVTYESLEGSQKEKNPYSQLPASHESLDDETRERSSYMTLQESKRKRDTPDYINIRI